MSTRLTELVAAWRLWSVTADRSEDGWESDFPEWTTLMSAAKLAMTEPDPDRETLPALAACWAAANEDEELREFAADNLESCWTTLEDLAGAEPPDCRWQVYEAVSAAGRRAEPILRRGLSDPDPYARRRALLALARSAPADAQAIAEAFLTDPDPYLRQSAIAMVVVSPDARFRRDALARLAADPVDHVRAAAESALREQNT